MSELETPIGAGRQLTRRLGRLWSGFRDRMAQVRPVNASVSPIAGLSDSQIDELAGEVFNRLHVAPQRDVVWDPHQSLMHLSAIVSRELDFRGDVFVSVVAIQAAINDLPAEARQTMCRFLENRTCKQIAQELQVSTETVMRNLILAHSHLRLRLRDPAATSPQTDSETNRA